MPLAQLDNDLLILLYDVARMIRRRADHMARQHGTTRAQWVLISRLARNPGLSQAELANLADVEPITMARLIDRMEARGLVVRRPDEKDRRLKRLYLTAEAQPLVDEVDGFRSQMNALATEGIDPQSLAQLRRTLLRMKANFADEKCRMAETPPLTETAAP